MQLTELQNMRNEQGSEKFHTIKITVGQQYKDNSHKYKLKSMIQVGIPLSIILFLITVYFTFRSYDIRPFFSSTTHINTEHTSENIFNDLSTENYLYSDSESDEFEFFNHREKRDQKENYVNEFPEILEKAVSQCKKNIEENKDCCNLWHKIKDMNKEVDDIKKEFNLIDIPCKHKDLNKKETNENSSEAEYKNEISDENIIYDDAYEADLDRTDYVDSSFFITTKNSKDVKKHSETTTEKFSQSTSIKDEISETYSTTEKSKLKDVDPSFIEKNEMNNSEKSSEEKSYSVTTINYTTIKNLNDDSNEKTNSNVHEPDSKQEDKEKDLKKQSVNTPEITLVKEDITDTTKNFISEEDFQSTTTIKVENIDEINHNPTNSILTTEKITIYTTSTTSENINSETTSDSNYFNLENNQSKTTTENLNSDESYSNQRIIDSETSSNSEYNKESSTENEDKQTTTTVLLTTKLHTTPCNTNTNNNNIFDIRSKEDVIEENEYAINNSAYSSKQSNDEILPSIAEERSNNKISSKRKINDLADYNDNSNKLFPIKRQESLTEDQENLSTLSTREIYAKEVTTDISFAPQEEIIRNADSDAIKVEENEESKPLSFETADSDGKNDINIAIKVEENDESKQLSFENNNFSIATTEDTVDSVASLEEFNNSHEDKYDTEIKEFSDIQTTTTDVYMEENPNYKKYSSGKQNDYFENVPTDLIENVNTLKAGSYENTNLITPNYDDERDDFYDEERRILTDDLNNENADEILEDVIFKTTTSPALLQENNEKRTTETPSSLHSYQESNVINNFSETQINDDINDSSIVSNEESADNVKQSSTEEDSEEIYTKPNTFQHKEVFNEMSSTTPIIYTIENKNEIPILYSDEKINQIIPPAGNIQSTTDNISNENHNLESSSSEQNSDPFRPIILNQGSTISSSNQLVIELEIKNKIDSMYTTQNIYENITEDKKLSAESSFEENNLQSEERKIHFNSNLASKESEQEIYDSISSSNNEENDDSKAFSTEVKKLNTVVEENSNQNQENIENYNINIKIDSLNNPSAEHYENSTENIIEETNYSNGITYTTEPSFSNENMHDNHKKLFKKKNDDNDNVNESNSYEKETHSSGIYSENTENYNINIHIKSLNNPRDEYNTHAPENAIKDYIYSKERIDITELSSKNDNGPSNQKNSFEKNYDNHDIKDNESSSSEDKVSSTEENIYSNEKKYNTEHSSSDNMHNNQEKSLEDNKNSYDTTNSFEEKIPSTIANEMYITEPSSRNDNVYSNQKSSYEKNNDEKKILSEEKHKENNDGYDINIHIDTLNNLSDENNKQTTENVIETETSFKNENLYSNQKNSFEENVNDDKTNFYNQKILTTDVNIYSNEIIYSIEASSRNDNVYNSSNEKNNNDYDVKDNESSSLEKNILSVETHKENNDGYDIDIHIDPVNNLSHENNKQTTENVIETETSFINENLYNNQKYSFEENINDDKSNIYEEKILSTDANIYSNERIYSIEASSRNDNVYNNQKSSYEKNNMNYEVKHNESSSLEKNIYSAETHKENNDGYDIDTLNNLSDENNKQTTENVIETETSFINENLYSNQKNSFEENVLVHESNVYQQISTDANIYSNKRIYSIESSSKHDNVYSNQKSSSEKNNNDYEINNNESSSLEKNILSAETHEEKNAFQIDALNNHSNEYYKQTTENIIEINSTESSLKNEIVNSLQKNSFEENLYNRESNFFDEIITEANIYSSERIYGIEPSSRNDYVSSNQGNSFEKNNNDNDMKDNGSSAPEKKILSAETHKESDQDYDIKIQIDTSNNLSNENNKPATENIIETETSFKNENLYSNQKNSFEENVNDHENNFIEEKILSTEANIYSNERTYSRELYSGNDNIYSNLKSSFEKSNNEYDMKDNESNTLEKKILSAETHKESNQDYDINIQIDTLNNLNVEINKPTTKNIIETETSFKNKNLYSNQRNSFEENVNDHENIFYEEKTLTTETNISNERTYSKESFSGNDKSNLKSSFEENNNDYDMKDNENSTLEKKILSAETHKESNQDYDIKIQIEDTLNNLSDTNNTPTTESIVETETSFKNEILYSNQKNSFEDNVLHHENNVYHQISTEANIYSSETVYSSRNDNVYSNQKRSFEKNNNDYDLTDNQSYSLDKKILSAETHKESNEEYDSDILIDENNKQTTENIIEDSSFSNAHQYSNEKNSFEEIVNDHENNFIEETRTSTEANERIYDTDSSSRNDNMYSNQKNSVERINNSYDIKNNGYNSLEKILPAKNNEDYDIDIQIDTLNNLSAEYNKHTTENIDESYAVEKDMSSNNEDSLSNTVQTSSLAPINNQDSVDDDTYESSENVHPIVSPYTEKYSVLSSEKIESKFIEPLHTAETRTNDQIEEEIESPEYQNYRSYEHEYYNPFNKPNYDKEEPKIENFHKSLNSITYHEEPEIKKDFSSNSATEINDNYSQKYNKQNSDYKVTPKSHLDTDISDNSEMIKPAETNYNNLLKLANMHKTTTMKATKEDDLKFDKKSRTSENFPNDNTANTYEDIIEVNRNLISKENEEIYAQSKTDTKSKFNKNIITLPYTEESIVSYERKISPLDKTEETNENIFVIGDDVLIIEQKIAESTTLNYAPDYASSNLDINIINEISNSQSNEESKYDFELFESSQQELNIPNETVSPLEPQKQIFIYNSKEKYGRKKYETDESRKKASQESHNNAKQSKIHNDKIIDINSEKKSDFKTQHSSKEIKQSFNNTTDRNKTETKFSSQSKNTHTTVTKKNDLDFNAFQDSFEKNFNNPSSIETKNVKNVKNRKKSEESSDSDSSDESDFHFSTTKIHAVDSSFEETTTIKSKTNSEQAISEEENIHSNTVSDNDNKVDFTTTEKRITENDSFHTTIISPIKTKLTSDENAENIVISSTLNPTTDFETHSTSLDSSKNIFSTISSDQNEDKLISTATVLPEIKGPETDQITTLQPVISTTTTFETSPKIITLVDLVTQNIQNQNLDTQDKFQINEIDTENTTKAQRLQTLTSVVTSTSMFVPEETQTDAINKINNTNPIKIQTFETSTSSTASSISATEETQIDTINEINNTNPFKTERFETSTFSSASSISATEETQIDTINEINNTNPIKTERFETSTSSTTSSIYSTEETLIDTINEINNTNPIKTERFQTSTSSTAPSISSTEETQADTIKKINSGNPTETQRFVSSTTVVLSSSISTTEEIQIDAILRNNQNPNQFKLVNDFITHESQNPNLQAQNQLQTGNMNDMRIVNQNNQIAQRFQNMGQPNLKGGTFDNLFQLPPIESSKASQQLTVNTNMLPMCFYGMPNQNAQAFRQPGYDNHMSSFSPTHTAYSAFGYPQMYPNNMEQQAMYNYYNNMMAQPKIGSPNFSNNMQNPYFCTYVPSSSLQFPPVPGVPDFRNVEPTEMPILDDPDDKTIPIDLFNNLHSNKSRSSKKCPQGELSCFDGKKCIREVQWCDGVVQCHDQSDELGCPCKTRVDKSRLCDGYFDCPNGEDELGCFGCSDKEFSCDDWTERRKTATCVPLEERCDGRSQCKTGKDEMDCSLLTNAINVHQTYAVSKSSGYLHRNYKGNWYPVCSNTDNWVLDACLAEVGPQATFPLIRMLTVPAEYKGKYLTALPDKKTEFLNSCMGGEAVYVICPPIPCGTRLLPPPNHFRKHEVDTSAEEDFLPFISRHRRFTEEIQNHGAEILGTNDLDEKIYQDYYKNNNLNINKNKDQNNKHNKKKHQERGKRGDSRVVGGKPSQPTSWPWVVAIYRDGIFHCGGVLMSELWVITAAHCIDTYWQHYYEVQAGMLRRFSYSPMEQNRVVSNIIGHQLYDRTDMKNDLALLKLARPFQFNRWVRPVCLPSESSAGPNWLWGPTPGTICTAVGWGATVEHGPDPDHMREVEVPILPHCKHREDEEGQEICAGYLEGGRDACQGDSGGPLLCRNPLAPSQWYVAGIVSHGEGCARPNEPGAYTRVSLYLNWIARSILEENLPGKRPLTKCPGILCMGTHRCIAKKRRCDKTIDCLVGDDEINCPTHNFPSLIKHALDNMLLFSTNNLTTVEPDNFPSEQNTRKSVENNNNTSKKNEKNIRKTDSNSGGNTIITIPEKSRTESGNITSSAFREDGGQASAMNRNDDISSTFMTPAGEISDVTRTISNARATEANIAQSPSIKATTFITTNDTISESSTSRMSANAPAAVNDVTVTTSIHSANDNGASDPTSNVINDSRGALNNGDKNMLDARRKNETTFSQDMNTATEISIMENTTVDSKRSNTANIIPDKFLCKNLIQVISISRRCNRIIDCEDGTDEMGCSCKEYLAAYYPEAICDGTMDCEDGGDEKNCNDCPETKFYCHLSGQCIPKFYQCDYKSDCLFGEDEWDCFALTNGSFIRYDKDDRPELRRKGIISVSHAGLWYPMCKTEWYDIAPDVADDMCIYLGFGGYQKFYQTLTIQESIRQISMDIHPTALKPKTNDTCRALYVKCTNSLSDHGGIKRGHAAHQTGVNTFKEILISPWNAAIFVNGYYTCSGTLVDKDWVITSRICLDDVFLYANYTTVMLGSGKGHQNVVGPHEQIRRVSEMVPVTNTDIILLRLYKPITSTRYVRPLYLRKANNVVTDKETCMAMGRDINETMQTIFLKPVLKKCLMGERCFHRVSPNVDCEQFTFSSSWGGIIVCLSPIGWYPAAVYYERQGRCGFKSNSGYSSIRYLTPNILAAMNTETLSVNPPICTGFRCPLGQCIEPSRICDGTANCRDGSDESRANCQKKSKECEWKNNCECAQTEMRCRNGKCVAKSAFCDRRDDCGDLSDEPPVCNCSSYLALVAPRQICDGIRNCYDKSDENPDVCRCGKNSFKCGTSGVCIPNDFVCDGEDDCPDMEDESQCTALFAKKETRDGVGELMLRTYGVWHSFCMPDTPLTAKQLEDICIDLSFTGAHASILNMTVDSNPALVIQIDQFSFVKLNTDATVFIRGDYPLATLKRSSDCKTMYLECT